VGEEGEDGGGGTGGGRFAADEGDGGFAVFVEGDAGIDLAVAEELAAARKVRVDLKAACHAARGRERPLVPVRGSGAGQLEIDVIAAARVAAGRHGGEDRRLALAGLLQR